LLAALCRFLLCEVAFFDIAEARQASGKCGRLQRAGPLSVWTDGARDPTPVLAGAVKVAIERHARITGFPARMERPVCMILFEDEEAFGAYTRATHVEAGRMMGYYSGFLRKRIVVCRQAAERPPSGLKDVIAHEVTHHLLHSALRRTPPAWLGEGIASIVASKAEGGLVAEGTGLRRLRACHARNELLPARRLFSLTQGELGEYGKDWRNTEGVAFGRGFYTQSTDFVCYLLERYGEAFKAFVTNGRRARWTDSFFGKCFGVRSDEVMECWLREMLAAVPPPFQPPPDALKQRIKNELLAPILDHDTPPDERLLAIRRAAACGYAWGAGALVRSLGSADDVVRADALRALEDISGEVRGENAGSWRLWLDSLPEEVSGPH